MRGEKEVSQVIESKQPKEFPSELVQKGQFQVFEPTPSIVHVVPTKARFTSMMKCKGKEVILESGSPTKAT
jgi:hypothetical protein